MTDTNMPQESKQQRDPVQTATKIGLAVFFVLGAVLLFMGFRTQQEFSRSGFSSEAAYQVIYTLSRDVESAWQKKLKPDLDKLSADERTALDEITLSLAADVRNSLSKDAAPDTSADPDNEAQHYKMLYAMYLVSGPKVGVSDRKAVTALPEDKAADFRLQMLQCILDETRELPSEAVGPVGDKTGTERQALLMNLFFVSSGSTEAVITENANNLKKAVRDKPSQLKAFSMIADGGVSLLGQLFISSSRPVMLIGIILMVDVLLLALLMRAEKLWVLDFKWIMILLIVDFLLYFQLLPLIFIIIKAVFPNGSFSFESLQRLFTYPMNLVALRNTFIAATVTMILGTAIAFPLAWLVGRTNLYGKKLFRFLFVVTYMVPPYVGAMAWLRLMNPNVGTINQWLRLIFHLSDALFGGSQPHFRRFSAQNRFYHHPADDDPFADRRCTAGVCQRDELLWHPLYHRQTRQCQYRDHTHCRICRIGTAGAQ